MATRLACHLDHVNFVFRRQIWGRNAWYGPVNHTVNRPKIVMDDSILQYYNYAPSTVLNSLTCEGKVVPQVSENYSYYFKMALCCLILNLFCAIIYNYSAVYYYYYYYYKNSSDCYYYTYYYIYNSTNNYSSRSYF